MARFLIVGVGEPGTALAGALEQEGHVACVLDSECRLGELLAALDHVAIVCWLAERVSPVRFLEGAIDSFVRSFAYQPGGWERELSETAAYNSIPTAVLPSECDDPQVWLARALETVGALLDGRYAAHTPKS